MRFLCTNRPGAPFPGNQTGVAGSLTMILHTSSRRVVSLRLNAKINGLETMHHLEHDNRIQGIAHRYFSPEVWLASRRQRSAVTKFGEGAFFPLFLPAKVDLVLFVGHRTVPDDHGAWIRESAGPRSWGAVGGVVRRMRVPPGSDQPATVQVGNQVTCRVFFWRLSGAPRGNPVKVCAVDLSVAHGEIAYLL